MWLCLFSGRRFEDTCENAQWRKVKQMQPMRLCILKGRQVEETHTKTYHCFTAKFSSIISYYIYETLIAKRLGGLNRNRNAGLSRYSNRKIQYFLSSVLEPRPRLRRWFGGTLMAPWHLEEWVHFLVRFLSDPGIPGPIYVSGSNKILVRDVV